MENSRLADIRALAIQVFESEQKADLWLHKPLRILDGMTPLQAIETTEGAQIVEDMLHGISLGSPA